MQLKNFQNILVVNPYGIGDCLFTTPVIRTLKENLPKARIGILLGSRTKEIFEHNPDVDSITVFDKGNFDKLNFKGKTEVLSNLFKKLKNKKYDLMIDLSNAPEYGFFGKFFLKIPERIGFDYRKRGRFLTKKIPLKGFEGKHIVEFYLDLLRLLKIPIQDKHLHFYLPEFMDAWSKEFLAKNAIKETVTIIGIVPGGGESWGKDSILKHWPKEYFALASKLILERLGARLLLFGSNSEKQICKEIMDSIESQAVDTSGKLSISELAGLFKKCNLIICNDGGPLHIAKSQNVNTISIFGPVDSTVYGPFPKTDRDIVLEGALNCRPCYRNFKMKDCRTKECLNSISPETVFEEVKFLIGKNGKWP